MTFDIYLNRQGGDINRTSPVLSLDIQEHAVLFCQNKELICEFNSVYGMSNFYADCVFLAEELEDLRQELVELDALIVDDQEAHALVAKIRQVVEMAIREKMAIYCVGD